MKLNYVQTLAVLIELFCAKMCFEFFQPLRFLIKSDCTFIKNYLNSQSYLSGRAVLLVLLLYSIPLHKLNNKSKRVWKILQMTLGSIKIPAHACIREKCCYP